MSKRSKPLAWLIAREVHCVFVYACVWLTDSEGETEAGKKHREEFNSSMLITSTSSQMAEGVGVKPLFTAILTTSVLILQELGHTLHGLHDKCVYSKSLGCLQVSDGLVEK